MIWDCTVTSSAVVGSSAIRTLRLADQRHRDHHALPHAARQLMRIFIATPFRRGDANAGERCDGAFARLPCGQQRNACDSASLIWSPTVKTGSSALIGSWKIIAISRPRTARISRADKVARSRPSNRIWPDSLADRGGNRRSSDRPVTVLPQPLSPTMPTRSPGVTEKLILRVTGSSPSEVLKATDRARTSRSVWAHAPAAGWRARPVGAPSLSRRCRRDRPSCPAVRSGTVERVNRASRFERMRRQAPRPALKTIPPCTCSFPEPAQSCRRATEQ